MRLERSNGGGPDRSDSGHDVANPYGNLELVSDHR